MQAPLRINGRRNTNGQVQITMFLKSCKHPFNLTALNFASQVGQKSKGAPHVFKSLYPWRTIDEFANHVMENIIYNEDGLIAINKPYGVALQSRDGAGGGSPFSLADALPALENTLKCGKISPAKITERFTSGVSLFTTDQHAVDRIRKSYEVNHSLKILPMKYWAVTLGTPQPQESQVKVALSWITHQNDERKSPVIKEKYTNKSLKKGSATEFRVAHRTVASCSTDDWEASLVEIDTSSTKNHFLRVYLSHTLSPILGDHIYGNRVQVVLGTRMAIGAIQADKLSTFQKIPANMLIKLSAENSELVPNCLHLRTMTLAKFLSNKSHLVITADPPEHFRHVCTTFSLQY